MLKGAFGNCLFKCAQSWAIHSLLLILFLPLHKSSHASPHPVGNVKELKFDAHETFLEDSLRAVKDFETFFSYRKKVLGFAALDLDVTLCLIANRNDGTCIATAREFNESMAPYLNNHLEEALPERRRSVFIARRRAYDEICQIAFENHTVSAMAGSSRESLKTLHNLNDSISTAYEKAYEVFLPHILKLFGKPKFHVFASTDSALIETIRTSNTSKLESIRSGGQSYLEQEFENSVWRPDQVETAYFPESLIEESRRLPAYTWSQHRKVPFGFLIYRRVGEFPTISELEYLLILLSERLSNVAGKDWGAESKRAFFTHPPHCENVIVDSMVIGLIPRRLKKTPLENSDQSTGMDEGKFRENAIKFKRIDADSLPDAIKASLSKTREKRKLHLLAGRFGEWWIERIPTNAKKRCFSGSELQLRRIARLRKMELDSIFRACSLTFLSKKSSQLSVKALASKLESIKAQVTASEIDSLSMQFPGVDRTGIIQMAANLKLETIKRNWIDENLQVLIERDSKGSTMGTESE